MNTRIHVIAALLTLLITASVTVWSEQKPDRKLQITTQKVPGDHPQTNTVTSQALTTRTQSMSHSKSNKGNAGDSIDVVGHLALRNTVVSNIRITEDQSTPMLEVTDKKSQTLSLVDVADPSHPKIVHSFQKPAELQNSRLEVEVGSTALFVEIQGAVPPAPRSISIVSFADPEGPRIVRKFADVTAISADHARRLIYLANPEGLWILQPNSLRDHVTLEKQFDEMLRTAMAP